MAPPQRAGDRTRPLHVDRPLFRSARLAAKVAIGCGFHMTYKGQLLGDLKNCVYAGRVEKNASGMAISRLSFVVYATVACRPVGAEVV